MIRSLIAATALALVAFAPDLLAQAPPKTTAAPCRPTANKPCPPQPGGPQKIITYDDPFKPDTKAAKPDQGDGWNMPRIKLDNDTTLGVGGLERKF